jgi:hypothetical protein
MLYRGGAFDLFPAILLGHFIGDYLLQNKWLVETKSRSNLTCIIHCIIYTAAVSILTWTSLHGWLWSLIIFCTHYPIDRYSLAEKWAKFINSRSLNDFIDNGHLYIPYSDEATRNNYTILRGSFTAIVYVVCDNTMHIFLMWYAAQWLMMR